MNQSAWEALVRHYNCVSKRFDKSKKEAVFLRNVMFVMERIPDSDRDVLWKHWQATGEAIHPFQGTTHPAPLFAVETNFAGGNMADRASGMMASEGCAFVFEAKLVHTAPGEVVQGLIAHEFGHALLSAKYKSKHLPLPESLGSSARTLEGYPVEQRHEEWLVEEIVCRWGYRQDLLELWEIAVEDCPNDPSGYYRRLKHSLRPCLTSHLRAQPMICAGCTNRERRCVETSQGSL